MAEQQDEEEPTLPTLPTNPSDMESETVSSGKRKRSYATHMFSDSSEPAIFSSDNDQAAENYIQGPRQKKQYRGTWDDHGLLSGDESISQRPRDRRRTLQPVDSGVFMASSDSMDESFDLPPSAASSPSQPRSSAPPMRDVMDQEAPPPQPEAEVLSIIQDCVDKGDMMEQRVDLSFLGLRNLSANVIHKLGEVLPIPRVIPDVAWTPFPVPNLKLFLAHNQLTRCPKEMFDLANLTVLSLRDNKLTEIPPAIVQLQNLAELNVSSNKLKYLPVELFELLCRRPPCRLRTLNLHPNPFHVAVHADDREFVAELQSVPTGEDLIDRGPELGVRSDNTWSPASISANHCWTVYPLRRTPVHFRDDDRLVRRQWRSQLAFPITSTTQERLRTVDVDSRPALPPYTRPTKVLSLVDICLQTMASTYPANTDWLEQVQSLRTFRDCPESAEASYHARLLQDMDAQRQRGAFFCTTCQKRLVRPVAQWIEWYLIAKRPQLGFHELVPVLRQTCTWACVEGERSMYSRWTSPGRGQSTPW